MPLLFTLFLFKNYLPEIKVSISFISTISNALD